jgi:hypothetical protein
MENKNLIIVGAILLGLVIIAGVFVLMGGSNNEKVEKVVKKVEEKEKKSGIPEKTETKEIVNSQTGEKEKVVTAGPIVSIEYEKDKLPKIDAVDAKLGTNYSVVSMYFDIDYNYDNNANQNLAYKVIFTTPQYYKKTNKFLIYLMGTISGIDYDHYIKAIEDSRKKTLEKLDEGCKNLTGESYDYCMNITNMTKQIMEKYFELFEFDKDTFEKMKKLSYDVPQEIIYYYDNGTEKIYLSKNLYAMFDSLIYTGKDTIIDMMENNK